MMILDLLSLHLMHRKGWSLLKNMFILYLFFEFFRQLLQSAHLLRSKELRLGVMLRGDCLDPRLEVDLPFVDGQPRWFAAFLKLLDGLRLK